MNDNFTLPPSPDLATTSQSVVIPQASRSVHEGSIKPTTKAITPTDPPSEDENTEENEIAEVKKTYKLTPKFNLFRQYYTQKGYTLKIKEEERSTQWNATVSTLKAYNLNPDKQYDLASSMGSQNVRKLKDLAMVIAEQRGYTFDKWLDKGWLQLLKAESPEWWDRIGDTLGFRSMKPQVVVDNRTQNNTLVQVGEGEQKSFNDQFRDFVKSS